MGDVIEFNKTDKLKDVTAAFTFSRLPREQRIAKTIFNALLGNAELYEGVDVSFPFFKSADDPFLVDLAIKLEPYARKDFAVRYGHLNDGKA